MSARDLLSLLNKMYRYPSPKNKKEKVENAHRSKQTLMVSLSSEINLIFHACIPKVCPLFANQK